MAVGDACKVEALALAVAAYFAAAPAIVDGSFAAASAPSDEGCCIVAAFDGTGAEAVLDEEGRLAARVAAEDACCLYAGGIDIAHVAQVA